MLTFVRTDSSNQNFITLVKLLDAYLSEKDGDEHAFYSQFNKIDKINHVILAYWEEQAVGCGAIKEYGAQITEIKRMYVNPDFRGRKIASKILVELEQWAKELQYESCILETGSRQTEAIELYKNNGYSITPNYGQYQNVENSVCFEKKI